MKTTVEILAGARRAKEQLPLLTTDKKNAALNAMANALLAAQDPILEANRQDVEAARDSLSHVMIDRLTLTPARLRDMADGILALISLPDPVGRILETVERPNGLRIEKISVPFGAVAIIYESRPNVTSDAAALALKSGNVCILRGGREAFRTSYAVVTALKAGLSAAGLDENLLQLIEETSHDGVDTLLRATDTVDLLIPRGGRGLISHCVENARVPVIQTGTGICHIFVDESADLTDALRIVENAKASRPSVCNAAEVCLVHRAVAADFLPRLDRALNEKRTAAGKPTVSFRCSAEALPNMPHGVPAGDGDFDTEFSDYIMAIGIVGDTEEACRHIALHSTHHSEAILTQSRENADRFTALVDSAAVYVNASTRFTDGGEFGLGCEMGISTQKLHARGPMGLRELTTYKYIIRGNGQTR